MRIRVLGTEMVGRATGGKLVSLGHKVRIRSRTSDNERALEWVGTAGTGASQGTLADVAAFGELVFNCTNGGAPGDALAAAGSENLAGKVLVDVANDLDFSQPKLLSESLGERIQIAFPESRVVKTLNTMNCNVMVEPSRLPGEHDVFVCGNDESAKDDVRTLLQSFGWAAERIVDLGDISGASGAEMYVVLWVRLYRTFGTGRFNVRVVR
jgi:8-hydroxy-5-deazaflavin:NADPH oxidoreductase